MTALLAGALLLLGLTAFEVPPNNRPASLAFPDGTSSVSLLYLPLLLSGLVDWVATASKTHTISVSYK